MRQYVISDTAVNGYYRFRYDPENSAVSATGQIDCSLGIPGVRQKMAGDISFDPEVRYPETIQCLDFDLGVAEPRWEIYTADDLRRQEQRGHQSLRERYRKEC